MKRKMALLLLIGMLLSVFPIAHADGDYMGTMQVINCKEWVSLRAYADTSAPRIMEVPLYACVDAYYFNNEFAECYYNGHWGYILLKYLGAVDGTSSATSYDSTGAYQGMKKIVNCNDYVSLRESPSTKSSRLAKVPLGAMVEAYYYNSEFSECCYNGQWGYILNAYLGSASAPTYSNGGDYLGERKIVNCNDWVSLRSSPSTKASRVTTVPLGAVVIAYSYNSEFAKCNYNGQWGYILNSYLGAVNAPLNKGSGPYSGSSASSGNSSSGYLGEKKIVNCNICVSLRKNPSTSATKLADVPLGAIVSAYAYDNEFAKCYYNGQWGYILKAYLGSVSSGATSAGGAYLGEMDVVNCEEWVSLRSSPSTSASRVAKVPLGETVIAYSYNSQFAKCNYNGQWGYVLLKYLDD